MKPDRFDVAIAGASYAGLALARALSQALGPDIRIALIDRTAPGAAAAGEDARASALSAASVRSLKVLGLWAELEAQSQPVTRIEITDSTLDAGVRPVLLAYDNHVASGEPASYIVPNAALMRALAESIAADPAVRLVAPAQVTGFAADGASVTVQLADGKALTAALLVAADGQRSALREAAGIKVVGWRYQQTGIVTTVAHERPHNGIAVQHFLPAGPFAILPLPGQRSCITWTENEAEAHRILALDDEGFHAEVDQRFGGRLGALGLEGPRQSWPLSMHLARAYVKPRFALIGDAAHGVHPLAGQGLNLALRDVAALAEVVVDAARLGLDLADAEALDRYERWRRFDSVISAATFDGLNRLFSNDWILLRAARDVGLGIVDRLPGLKRFFVAEAAGVAGDLPRLLKGEPV